MSFRNVQGKSLDKNNTLAVNPTALINVPPAYYRNPSWLALPSVTSGEQKFVGLYLITRFANFIALNFTTSTGQYTVNWGDGSAAVNVNSNTAAQYEYDYNDVDLAGTDAPVTFTASGSTVDRTSHGYTNGMTISFATIVTTTGIAQNTPYYVVNATANTLQLSLTENGSVITLTNDGTGIILPYKQVIVTVTPVSGNLTVCNLNVKHNQAGLPTYATGWLDVAMAGAFTTITVTNGVVLNNNLLEIAIKNSNFTSFASLFANCENLRRVNEIVTAGNLNSTATMFNNCFSLSEVALFNTANVTNMSSMFQSCRNLTTVPLYNTASVTNMSSMFNSCQSLNGYKLPLLNTANVTAMNSMFQSCTSLQTIPIYNTANVTNMSSMFNGCTSLENVPYLNTNKVTNMSSMFASCRSLKTIPVYDTANVTTMGSIFSFCSGLLEAPFLNTIKVTDMSGMFNGAISLQTIPIYNTANVTSTAAMFVDCTSLRTIPNLNLIKNTLTLDMFTRCTSLTYVPDLNCSNVTNAGSMFNSCTALIAIPMMDLRKVGGGNGMNQFAFNCRSLQYIPQILLANCITWSDSFSSCINLKYVPDLDLTAKFATSAQSQNPFLNTNSLREIGNLDFRKFNNIGSFGWLGATPSLSRFRGTPPILSFGIGSKFSGEALNEVYTNLIPVGGSVTFDVVADTATKVAHGYQNGQTLRFSAITGTTGITINTIYYVKNVTADTFQLVAPTLGPDGAVINLTGVNGTGTIHGATITVTGNYGTTSDDPTIATNKGWLVTGS